MATANDPHAQDATILRLAEEMVGAAQRESIQSSRSRLAPFASAISVLREKDWSFSAITLWLDQRGVHVAESTVQRFYRSQQRRKARSGQQSSTSSTRTSAPQSTNSHEIHDHQASSRTVRAATRPKYNTDF